MRKKFLLVVALLLLVMPICTFAASKDSIKEYESMNLEETLKSEDIELKYDKYKETKDQVTIYMFRGKGCSYCRGFLEYLNGITEKYGKYFKLESYEVWANSKNTELYEDVTKFLGQEASGVPFIVIGDQVFPGYSEEYNEGIETAIKDLYDSKEKYDVLEELEKYKKEQKRQEFFQSGTFAIIIGSITTTISTIIILLFVNSKVNNLNAKLEKLESKLKTVNNKEEKVHKEEKENKTSKNQKNKK